MQIKGEPYQNIMISYSIVFATLVGVLHAATLPCSINCATCSSSTQCITCASQYFANSSTGSLQCQPCGSFCLACSSSSNCTTCLNPYVLQADGSCKECSISNAAKCTTTVAASQCQGGYYVSDNYCYSCLLNCADCTSNSDCRSCFSGYYLNSSVLTCNFCPSNCLTCDQYNSTRCLTCVDGYGLSSSYTCDAISCSISNCLYCSSVSVCKQCADGYYWSSTQSTCMLGASVMCEYGAQGPYPNQCNNKCSKFSYIGQQNSTALWCLPYNNIGLNGSRYSQVYYYCYNNLATMNSLLSAQKSLTLQTTGEYSIALTASDNLTISTLPGFYKITISLKYKSSTPLLLTLISTTESATQQENVTIPAYSAPSVYRINTTYLHSNNLNMKFNASLQLVEILIRTKNCPSNCYRCLNEDLCEMCMAPQYVSSYKCVDNCTIYYHLTTNRSCLTTCPDFFYPATLGENQKYCQPCVSPCNRCLSADKCLSCAIGKYLFNYTCVAICPDTYYPGASGYCQSCISPCQLCKNQTSCISCKEGYWDSIQGVCTVKCPAGYYGNDTTKNCQLCQSPCLTCRNTSTRCLTCIAGLYYQDYQCLSACPQRYYPNTTNLSCLACVPPCLTCTSSSSCLSCSFDYLYNNTCVVTCPIQYFQSLATRSCQSCSQNCKTCEMLGECTSCKPGTCYLEGDCVTNCPTGKYYTLILNKGTINEDCSCQQCKYPCKECLSASSCTSCLVGYLLLTNNSCLNSCPTGYFANSAVFQCSNCSVKYSSNCLECDYSSCTRCGSNYLLHNGICISTCPSQHYKSSETCQKCVAPCLECSSFTQCLSCMSPYLFSNGSCIIQCPFGKVSFLDNTTNILSCISCQLPCVTCQNSSPTNCSMCEYGYFLYSINNTCVPQCSAMPPANTYYNELVTSTCSMCMFPCQTCTSQTQCLTCQIGFLTSAGKCENCPFGTYANITGGICLTCPTQCSNCYAADYCTGCQEGYYLYGHQCVSNISICLINGYYPIGRICQPCQMPCLLCNLTSSNCLSCVAGYIFYAPNMCITECPKGTFRNGSQCSPCHSYCQSCSGSDTYCFGCKSTYLMVSSSMKCVTACPSGSFEVGSTCQLCQYPCLQCSSQAQCKSCLSGTLVGTTCLSSCPNGYFSESMTCKICQSPCSECQTSPTLCKQCINGYYLFNNQCLPTCPAFYFGQPQAHQCLECLGLCGECSSHINCTTCNTGYAFYNNTAKNYGQCVSECPIGFYEFNQTSGRDQCLACLPQCLTCINNEECILCKNNKVQYQGQCLSECPPRMYPYNGVCQDCSPPCFNCTDTFTCTACMDNSFLLVGSAECIVGEVCPVGFYRIPNTRNCNGRCPSGFYHRNDRTCNDQGCGVDEYKGADMFCYSKCPDGYKSDQTYKCQPCQGNDCKVGLFYSLEPFIVRDQFFLSLVFDQDPIYLLEQPQIKLNPPFDFKIQRLQTQRLLTSMSHQRMLTTSVSQRNLTIELFPEQSFQVTYLTLTFESALATFKNPIQRPSKTVILDGFDLYPQTISISLGYLLLACALVGLVKSPYMTDFAQFIYLLALTNLHYPTNLATALQSGALAHLHGFIRVSQLFANGKAKFSYITDMGLLSNCTINLLIMAIFLTIFLILFIIYQILKKSVSYNKVDQDPNEIGEVEPQANTHKNENNNRNKELSEESCSVRAFRFLQCQFVENFKMNYLNRLIYFNYSALALFTFSQLSSLSFNSASTIDLVSSILSFFVLIGLLVYPWMTYSGSKPKYTFLMLRKLVLGLVVVLSVQDPTYMIGVAAVLSIMSGILVGAYGMQKWKVETRFNAGMQIAQAVMMILFAVFAIIGEGRSTTLRMYLSWAIVFLVIGICLAYMVFCVFCMVLWGCKKFKGTDYIQIWSKKEPEAESEKNSEQNSHEEKEKEKQTAMQSKSKTITLEKLMINTKKQWVKEEEEKPALPTPTGNTHLFWTYNDNNSDGETGSEAKAPDMLIRCVNQFSDYDHKEKRQQ